MGARATPTPAAQNADQRGRTLERTPARGWKTARPPDGDGSRLAARARLPVTEPGCAPAGLIFPGAATLSGMCKAQAVTLTA